MFGKIAAVLIALLLAAPARAAPPPASVTTLAAMERMADWQLARMTDLQLPGAQNPRDWQQAAFWIGMTALADRSANPRYRDAILGKGREVGWRLGDRPYHADDQAIGAVWLWAWRHGAGPESLAPVRAKLDSLVEDPHNGSLDFPESGSGKPDCTDRWCWCDALFMAPPTLWSLTDATGDPRYADYVDSEYSLSALTLFDREENLFYRDSRFIDRRGEHGEKLFWSRGNGWVMSGLARLIPLVPPDYKRRTFYLYLFTHMAARIVTLQRANGDWPPSLLGDPATAPDETSGTGFFVHALAWGIEARILPRAQYLPAVTRGWAALQRAIQPDGRLGWVQQVSDRPDKVAASDTQFYGVGAYLLAGAAVYDLAKERRR